MEKTEAIEEKPSVECYSRKRKNRCQSISDRTGYSLVRVLRSRRVYTRDVPSVIEGEGGNLKSVIDPYLDSSKSINGELEIPQLQVSKAEVEEIKVRQGENLKVQANLRNGTTSKGKMAVNACPPKKVFINARSVSYHKLLPYLKDNIDGENPDLSNFEIVDARNPCPTAELQKLNPIVRSSSVNGYSSTPENVVTWFNGKAKLEKEHIPVPTEVPCNGQSLNCTLEKVDDLEHKNPDKVKLEKEAIPKVPTEVPCNGQSLTCMSEKFVPQVDDLEHKGSDNVSSVFDDLTKQEHCQMTPPDSDIVAKIDSNRHENTGKESNAVSENKTDGGSPVASEQTTNGNFEQSPNFKNGVDQANGMVLKPCSRSRLKVFNNPRSLNYRRLLPFLMDISKDNSGSSVVIEPPRPKVKLREESHSPSATSAEQNNANKVATEYSYEKQNSEETVPFFNAGFPSPDTNPSPPTPQSLSSNCSSTAEDNSITSLFQPCSITDDGNLMDQSHLDEPGPVEMPKGCFRIAQDAHNSGGESINNDSPRQSSIIIGASDTPVLPNVRQEEAHKSKVKSVKGPSLSPSSFQIEACSAPIAPSTDHFKGILNGNPRGCRGQCNCLNCASFRLHADRAFEFSRNQMHDAAEVAFTLMDELKNIRSMLKKSASYDNGLNVPQLNMVQVKEACNKALQTENLAKERLSQMNYELNVHCIIPALQQRKVTFSNYLQERLVPMKDPSIHAEEKRRRFIKKRSKVNDEQ